MAASVARAPLTKAEIDQRLEVCAAKHNRLRRLTRDQLEEEIQRAFRGLKISVEPIGPKALEYVDNVWTPAV